MIQIPLPLTADQADFGFEFGTDYRDELPKQLQKVVLEVAAGVNFTASLFLAVVNESVAIATDPALAVTITPNKGFAKGSTFRIVSLGSPSGKSVSGTVGEYNPTNGDTVLVVDSTNGAGSIDDGLMILVGEKGDKGDKGIDGLTGAFTPIASGASISNPGQVEVRLNSEGCSEVYTLANSSDGVFNLYTLTGLTTGSFFRILNGNVELGKDAPVIINKDGTVKIGGLVIDANAPTTPPGPNDGVIGETRICDDGIYRKTIAGWQVAAFAPV